MPILADESEAMQAPEPLVAGEGVACAGLTASDIEFARAVTVTGHRPKALFGYNFKDIRYLRLYDDIYDMCEDAYNHGYRWFIEGGAQGGDEIFGNAAIKLRETYPDVKVVVAIPFTTQHEPWPPAARSRYEERLAKADLVWIVDEERALPKGSQLPQPDPDVEPMPSYIATRKLFGRNIWMLDKARALIAIWNGSTEGGTFHCLSHAMKQERHIVRYNPETRSVSSLKSLPPAS